MAAFLGEAIAKLILDTSGFTRELDKAGGKLDKFRGQADAISDGLSTIGRGFVAAGVGIGAALTVAVKQAADFQTVMQNVAAISPEVATNMDAISEGVLRIATETGRMPTDLAEGLYEVIQAAIPAGQALEFLEVSAKAANAGLTSVATAVHVNAAIINSGIKSMSGEFITLTQASDISFQAVNNGLFTYEEWASQIGDVLPLAASLGVTLEEVAAAVATMTQNGQSLAESTTQLNAVFSALLKPTADTEQMFKDMGYESGQALLETEGFTKTIELLNAHLEKTGDNTSDFSKNIRAIRGFLGLTNDEMERYNDNLDDMENSTGATNRALAQQQKTLSFALRELKANLSALAISVGTLFLPAITAITKAITAIVKAINKMPDSIKAAVAVFASLAAAGFILAGSLALATSAIFRIGLAFKYLEAAGLGIVGPIAALRGSVGLLATGLSRIGAAVLFLLNPMNLLRGLAVGLVGGFRLLGRGLVTALLLPLRLILSPLTRVVYFFRIFGLALVSLASRVLSIRGALSVMGIAFTRLFPLISGITFLLLRMVPIIGIAFAAFAAWKYLEEPILSVYNALKNLLGLGDDVKDFFDFEAETKHVDKNSDALDKNRRKLRDRIAEALGVQTKKDRGVTISEQGIDPTFGEPAQRAEQVDFLKRLDRALEASGNEIRSWSNKMKIGKRAIGDFFDIARGKGGKDELKLFRARLNDIFGPEVGGQIYEASKNLRTAIGRFKNALDDLFGSGATLDIKAGIVSLLEGLNRLSAWFRGSGIQALGSFIARMIDLAATLTQIAAAVLRGDFGEALKMIPDLITQFVEDFVIPDIKLRIAAVQIAIGVIEWLAEGAWDLVTSLWRWLFGGTETSTSFNGMTGTTASTTVKVPGVLTPLLSVDIPQFISDVFTNLADALGRWLFGGTETVSGNSAMPGQQGGGPMQVKVPGVLTPLIEIGKATFTMTIALFPQVVAWVAGETAKVTGKVVGRIEELSIRVGRWIIGSGLSGAIGLIAGISEFVTRAIRAVPAGQIWGEIEELAIRVGGFAFRSAGGLLGSAISIISSLSTFVYTAVSAVPEGYIWATLEDVTVAVGSWSLDATTGIATSLSESIASAIISTAGFAGNVFSAVGTVLSTSQGIVFETVPNVASSIWTAIADSVKAVPGLADSVFSAIGDVLRSASNISISNEDLFNFGTSLGAALHTVISTAVTLPLQIGMAIGNALSNVPWSTIPWATIFVDLPIAMFAGISKALTAPWIKAGELIGDMFRAVNWSEVTWSTIFVDLPKAMFDGIMTVAGWAKAGFDLATHIATSIDDGMLKVLVAGSTIALKIGAGVASFLSGVLIGAVTGKDIKWDDVTQGIRDGFIGAIEDVWSGTGMESADVNPDALDPFGGGGELFTNIVPEDGLSKIIQPIIDFFTGLPGKVVEGLGDFDFGDLTTFLQGKLDGLNLTVPKWIDTFINELSEKFKSIKDKISEIANFRKEERDASLRDQTVQQAEGPGDASVSSKTERDPMTGQDLPVVEDADPTTVEQEVTIVTKFGFSFLGTKYNDLAGAVGAAVKQLETAPPPAPIPGSGGGGLSGIGKSIGDSIISGLTTALPLVTTAATSVTQAVFTTFQTFLPTATSMGTEIGDNISSGLATQVGAATTAATAITQAIFAAFQSFLGTATDMGVETGDNFASGVSSMEGAASTAGSSLANAATNAMSGGYGAAYGAGQNIGQGLADGIQSMVGAAMAAANAIISAVNTAIAYQAKLGSPSKVTIQFGKWIGEGLAIGMTDTTGLVEKAGSALAKATVPNLTGPARVGIATHRPSNNTSSTVSFNGATFVVPNMDTAAEIESYFLSLSRR